MTLLRDKGLRALIIKAVAVCALLATAPWLTGGQEPLGRLLSGFALLLGVMLVWRQPEAPLLKRGPLIGLYGALMLLAGLSMLWTANRFSTALWVSEWVMAGLAFKLAYTVAGSPVGRKWLIRGYLLSAGVFAVAAVYMYLTSEYGRLTGTFYWANPAAAYLIPAILLTLDGMRRTETRRKYGWTAALIGFSATFLLTDSRAATAVLALIVVLYIALAKLSKRFWIHLLFSAVLGWGVSFGLVKISSITSSHGEKVAPGSRLSEAVKGESSSGSDRLYYLQSALDMWVKQPVLGVGAGAYGDVHPSVQRRVVSASANAHNVYAQMLSELGLLGAMLLSGLIIVLFIGCLRGLTRRPELLPVALGLAGLLLHMGLDIDASYPALLMLVGIFCGLIYTQSSTKWVKSSLLAPICAILVLVPAVSVYLSSSLAERGVAAQDDAEYDLAQEYFARASQYWVSDPDYLNAEGINLYALAVTEKDSATAELELALKQARRAEVLDPYDAQHFWLESRLLRQQGKLEAAERAFAKTLEKDAYNHPEYAYDLAATQARRGKREAGLATIDAMLKQYPAAVLANRSADDSLKYELARLKVLRRQIEAAPANLPS